MPKIRHTPVIHVPEPEKSPSPEPPVPMKAKGKAAPKAAAAKPKAAAKAAPKPKTAPKAAAKPKSAPKTRAQKTPSPSNSAGSEAEGEDETKPATADAPAAASAAAAAPKKPVVPEFKPPPLPFKHFTFTPPPLSYMNILNNGSAHYTFQPLIPVRAKNRVGTVAKGLDEEEAITIEAEARKMIQELKQEREQEEKRREKLKEEREGKQEGGQEGKHEEKQAEKHEKHDEPQVEMPKVEQVHDHIKEEFDDEVEVIESPFELPWDRPQVPIKVTSQIYLSTYEQACSPHFVRDNNIALVFSFGKPVPFKLQYHSCVPSQKTKYYHFDCERHSQSDLLSHFEPVADILERVEAKTHARVLLHCDGDDHAICASFLVAYLMRKRKSEDSLEVRWQVAMIDLKVMPHPMFFDQLALFEQMGKRCDPLNSDYRHFMMCAMNRECGRKLGLLAGSVELYKLPSIVKLFRDYIDKLRPDADAMAELDKQCSYYCMNCEAYLFNELNVVKAKDWFVETTNFKKLKALKMIKHKNEALEICNKYYIEPMDWMFSSGEPMDPWPLCTINSLNQILCRECESVLGLFDITGAICPTRFRGGSCSKHADSEYCMFEIYQESIYARKASQAYQVQLNPLPVQQFGFNFMVMQAREAQKAAEKALEKEPEEMKFNEIRQIYVPKQYLEKYRAQQLQGTSGTASEIAESEQPEPKTEEPMEGISSG